MDFKSAPLRNLLLWLALFAATLITYGPALHGSFLWDDNIHVTPKSLQSLHGLYRLWFEPGATPQYYPLLYSAFWFEHRLWGDFVLGYHLVNVLLHATSALLVVAIARRLRLPGAMLAGFIFALHPVCVESVAWISEQKNTLSTAFGLAAIFVYLGFDQTRHRSAYFVASALFLLALLTKTVTATLPAALLVVFWWMRGRLDVKRDVAPLLPWLIAGAAAGLVSVWSERTFVGAQGADYALDPIQRVLLAARVVWFYTGKLLWPSNLIFIYPRWIVDPGDAVQFMFLAALVGVLVALIYWTRRNRGPLAAVLIFSGTLFPVMGFLNVYPFRYSYVADHFQYLASLGLIIPIAAALALAAARISFLSGVAGKIAATTLIALLGGLTWHHAAVFRDAQSLYVDVIERNPNSSMAHNNLGEILLLQPNFKKEAVEHFRRAIEADPRNAEAHLNLGRTLIDEPGDFANAIAEYEAALQLKPNLTEAHNNLGVALSRIPGRTREAIEHFETALRAYPDVAEIHDNLGAALSDLPDRQSEALQHFLTAARLDPDSSRIQNHLGVALIRATGSLAQAIPHFERAVSLDPQFAEAHRNLGRAWSQTPGKMADALQELELATQLDPKSADTHAEFAMTLVNAQTRFPDAIQHLEAAIRLQPNFAQAHFFLGILLASLPDRRDEALTQFEATLKINPGFAPAEEWVQRLRARR